LLKAAYYKCHSGEWLLQQSEVVTMWQTGGVKTVNAGLDFSFHFYFLLFFFFFFLLFFYF